MHKLNKHYIIVDDIRTLVYKHCNANNISVRQFMIELGESGTSAWDSLCKYKPSYGKLNLLLKLLKFFNYDNKTENRI